MANVPAIEIIDLSKQYPGNEKYSLDKLSLSVQPGEVYGFLGPNGAGKSTTIRLLMNFLKPTSGNAKILGMDIVENSVEIKQSVGYLSGDFDVYSKMNGKQYLTYMQELQNVNSTSYSKVLLNKLQAITDRRLGKLSRGQRQKIGIVQAFMHKPQILILDEPTSGLDPLMQEVFYELVKDAKGRGAAVFVSSHIMSEVQKMCDRVGIIRDGKLITEKSISDMVDEAAQTFDITFVKSVPADELKKVEGLKLVQVNGQRATIHLHGELKALFRVLGHHDVSSIDARSLDLEEMFLHYYQDGEEK